MCNNDEKKWAQRLTLFDYLNSKKFVIPVYQRDFVWKKDQITEFLEELYLLKRESIKNEDAEMFVGSIYLLNKKEKSKLNSKSYEIIDGQQRTILFYFLKFFFLNDACYSISSLLKKYYEASKSYPGTRRKECDTLTLEWINELLIILSNFEISSITGKFEEGIFSKGKKSKLKERSKDFSLSLTNFIDTEIINNSNDFENDLDEDWEKDSEAYKIIKIFKFIKFIFTKISLIEIQIKPFDDINEIFKSINSKGRILSQWDLIRNEIYKNSISNIQENQKKEIEQQLNEVDSSLEKFNEKWFVAPEEFVWSYIIFKQGKYISKKNLANEFATLSNDKKITLSTFLSDINKYSDILDNYDKTLNQFKWFFYICKEIRAIQIKTIVLSVFMEQDFKNYNLWIERLLVNYIVLVNIGGKRANYFEKFFKSKKDETLKIMLENNQDVINNLFESQDFYKENQKYIENFENDEKAIEGMAKELIEANQMIKVYIYLKTSKNYKERIFSILHYEYEHVLPKNFDEWKNFDPLWINMEKEEIEEYVEKIGNIILLKSSLNKEVSNKLLSCKMEKYFCETLHDEKTGKEVEPEHTIFCKGLDLFDPDLLFLKPIFWIFQDAYKEKILLEFSPKLIEKRTTEISSIIAKLFLNKL